MSNQQQEYIILDCIISFWYYHIYPENWDT